MDKTICEVVDCPKRGSCPYSPEGIEFRTRQGYCPLIDRPQKVAVVVKKRAGQQKQKGGK